MYKVRNDRAAALSWYNSTSVTHISVLGAKGFAL